MGIGLGLVRLLGLVVGLELELGLGLRLGSKKKRKSIYSARPRISYPGAKSSIFIIASVSSSSIKQCLQKKIIKQRK